MEEYKVLTNLPKDNYFGTWEKKDVKAFGKWFMAEKDNRMQMLFDEVHRDPEFADWQPDFSPESLKTLGCWFGKNITSEPMTENEYNELVELYQRSRGMVVLYKHKITQKARSLTFDVATYVGEVLLHELGDRDWEQYIYVSKNNYDYGYMSIPVIPAPKHKWTVTPWRRITTLAARVIYSHTYKKEDLYTTFVNALNELKNEMLKLPSNKETPENK